MVYSGTAEMNIVTGKLDDNTFIKKELADLKTYKAATNAKLKRLGLA
jgi:hypothetical protein